MSISSAIASDKLSDLRLKKKIAIQSLDFDMAEQLDQEIENQNQEISNIRINKIKQEIMKEINELISKYLKNKKDINEFKFQNENLISSKFQELYDKTIIQHEKELKSLEKSHYISLIREAEREVPDQFDLLEKAKFSANEGKYQEAKKMREEARIIGENELHSRKEKVDEEFASSKLNLATRQQLSLDDIAQKYNEEINLLNLDFNTKLDEIENRFQNGINLIKEKGKIRSESLIEGQTAQENSIFEINQLIQDMVNSTKENTDDIFWTSRPNSLFKNNTTSKSLNFSSQSSRPPSKIPPLHRLPISTSRLTKKNIPLSSRSTNKNNSFSPRSFQ